MTLLILEDSDHLGFSASQCALQCNTHEIDSTSGKDVLGRYSSRVDLFKCIAKVLENNKYYQKLLFFYSLRRRRGYNPRLGHENFGQAHSAVV